MKEPFFEKKFNTEQRIILDHIVSILRRYSAEGYDLSLRQLYYQLIAADLLPSHWEDPTTHSTNNEKSYKKIGTIVSDARLAGIIDWDMITDRGRVTVSNSHWESPQEIIKSAAEGFRIDKWADQPSHVEVMVEKQALEGVLIPVCNLFDVSFTANKGYSSSSSLYEIGKRLEERLSDGKKVHVIYLGDHDPSGIDMTRDISVRLNLFANVIPYEALAVLEKAGHRVGEVIASAKKGKHVEVHRVALNLPQIKDLNPPENPAKMTDSRAEDYVARFGDSSWELDAIEPKALARLVGNKIEELRDGDLWLKSLRRENDMKAELLELAKKSKFKS